jgi:hypothetical protein
MVQRIKTTNMGKTTIRERHPMSIATLKTHQFRIGPLIALHPGSAKFFTANVNVKGSNVKTHAIQPFRYPTCSCRKIKNFIIGGAFLETRKHDAEVEKKS